MRIDIIVELEMSINQFSSELHNDVETLIQPRPQGAFLRLGGKLKRPEDEVDIMIHTQSNSLQRKEPHTD